jgi:hypothetical protein
MGDYDVLEVLGNGQHLQITEAKRKKNLPVPPISGAIFSSFCRRTV